MAKKRIKKPGSARLVPLKNGTPQNKRAGAALPEIEIDASSELVTRRLNRIANNYEELGKLLDSVENLIPEPQQPPPEPPTDDQIDPRKPR